MDDKMLKKMEQDSQAIQIRAGLESLKHLPFIPDDIKQKINEEFPKALPVIKDFIKLKLYELSQKLGAGADKKIYVLRNGKSGPEFWVMKNMRAFDGDREIIFPLQTILDRIEKCDKIETLLAEVLSFRILAPEEEVTTIKIENHE